MLLLLLFRATDSFIFGIIFKDYWYNDHQTAKEDWNWSYSSFFILGFLCDIKLDAWPQIGFSTNDLLLIFRSASSNNQLIEIHRKIIEPCVALIFIEYVRGFIELLIDKIFMEGFVSFYDSLICFRLTLINYNSEYSFITDNNRRQAGIAQV